jgi:hypothetical protein
MFYSRTAPHRTAPSGKIWGGAVLAVPFSETEKNMTSICLKKRKFVYPVMS